MLYENVVHRKASLSDRIVLQGSLDTTKKFMFSAVLGLDKAGGSNTTQCVHLLQ